MVSQSAKHRLVTGFLLLSMALLGSPAVAEIEQTILAFDGQPVRIHQALYGDLDPLGSLADPRSSVLALEWPSSQSPHPIELVPGTQGPEREGTFSLLYDRDSETLFVFWESLGKDATALNLVGRAANGTWTKAAEISGSPFNPKTPPVLAITHESFVTEREDGSSIERHQSILHLVWSENRDDLPVLVYSPVLLENGAYLGPNAIYNLSDLAGGEVATEAPAPTPSLLESLVVTAGRDRHSVVLAFADPRSRRLVTLRIESLWTDLVSVADGARSHIVVIGERPTIRQVSDTARSHIVVIGHRIHPGIREFMLQSIERGLEADADTDGRIDAQLAGSIVWDEIIRAGASVEDQGLLDEETLEQPQILEVIARGPDEPRSADSPLLQMRVVSSRPVPETGDSPQTRMFASPDARDVIVCWLNGKRLLYVESQADGWSGVQGFDLGEHLSLAAAYELLERRVR